MINNHTLVHIQNIQNISKHPGGFMAQKYHPMIFSPDWFKGVSRTVVGRYLPHISSSPASHNGYIIFIG